MASSQQKSMVLKLKTENTNINDGNCGIIYEQQSRNDHWN